MKDTRVIMGMPISVEVVDLAADKAKAAIEKAFAYFVSIDERFSTYKKTSEITVINEGKIKEDDWSEEMRMVFLLSEETKKQTNGYFDIKKADGAYDPSGLVKGWSIWNAAHLLRKEGSNNFYVDAGGDIQVSGKNAEGDPWAVGIKNPWDQTENVKIVYVETEGVATSGTYIRGLHIYDPHKSHAPADDIVSLTVIGPNIYEADRFATAAFAMGKEAIHFIEHLQGFEGYMIDKNKNGTMTSGFEKYTNEHA